MPQALVAHALMRALSTLVSIPNQSAPSEPRPQGAVPC
jgi:hypothetical protein